MEGKYKLGSYLSERVLTDSFSAFIDEKKARSLYEKWCKEIGVNKKELLDEYLSSYQLSDQELLHYIDKRRDINSVTECAWMHKWEEIIEITRGKVQSEIDSLMKPMDFPFSRGVSPLIVWAKDQLANLWNNLSKTYELDKQSIRSLNEDLLYNLCRRLTLVAAPSYTLEMHIDKMLNKLEGEDSKERYNSFIRNRVLEIDALNKTLTDYPVLIRLFVTYTENWVHFITEAIERFYQDKEQMEIQMQLSVDSIKKIEGGISDLHRKGKSVLVFHFNNGKKVLYKPKSLAISKHFQDLLSWINQKEFTCPFPIQKIIDHDEYGWEEFIDKKDCEQESQVKNFYFRQGGYLGVLYLLEATDFHYENIIASGEYPVLIDLESLFHHREDAPGPRSSAMVHAKEKLESSVLRTQLLPFLVGGYNQDQGMSEISGLGGKGGQQTPFTRMDWDNIGTDEMKVVRRKGTTKDANNLPVLNGESIELLHYKEDLINGFETIYKLFMEHKEELRHFVTIFKDDKTRQVLRPTYVYALLLEGGHHPDFLQNGIDRERLMGRLWSGLDKAIHLKKVVSAEIDDLLIGDIPYFYSKPHSKDLWTSNDQKIKDYFPRDSFSQVLKRCEDLSYDDLLDQTEIIKASLGVGNKNHEFKQVKQKNNTVSPHHDAPIYYDTNRSDFLVAAIDIGNHLASKAIWGSDRKDVTWLGLQWMGNYSQWQYSLLDAGLYNGLSGIAYFTSYLAKVTNIEKFKDLSLAALNAALYFTQNDQYLKNISAYQGNNSVVYTMIHLSQIWNDTDLLEQAIVEAHHLKDYINHDKEYDVLGGVAGAIPVYLQLYNVTGDKAFLDNALHCGEHLIRNAQKTEHGYGWVNSTAHRPVVGFSHGSAGIAWSLSLLYDHTGDSSFKQMAQQALEYERSLFLPEHNNWLDYRVPGDQQLVGPHWCNGAPGIGISRIVMSDSFEDKQFKEEIRITTQLTKETINDSHCLCHGDLGNLLSLQFAAAKSNNYSLQKMVEQKAQHILRTIDSVSDWECGSIPGVQMPGLMLGLSGIGHGLLQLARPQEVPSPLYLEPPKNSQERNSVEYQKAVNK
ncbi:type 2 lanthipeptide synthetase LanM family protein [Gracilibacillus suaedae]|uniref:type 2 lanthipeptide synthetase LanM family protein n=1 Tax=Gracilibacillus suaedae TaxID=2820273 RepID=UPI001ABE1E97|nr:type 2 lanthipeptide synthetase LanM family protein [Gracilibacillus suaedae]